MSFWTLGEDGLWRQKRLSLERARAAQSTEKARDAARARWLPENSPGEAKSASPTRPQVRAHNRRKPLKWRAVGDASASPGQCHPYPFPNPERESLAESRAREAATVRQTDGIASYSDLVRKADLITSGGSMERETLSIGEVEAMLELELVTREQLSKIGLQ